MIGISETWLSENNQNVYDIKGYLRINNCSPGKWEVMFFLLFNASLKYCRRDDLSTVNNSIESIFVDASSHPLTQTKCVTLLYTDRQILIYAYFLRICRRYLRI